MKSFTGKILFFGLVFLMVSRSFSASAASDTVFVQAFNFGPTHDSTFNFPPAGQYRKVLMYYTLKCDPKQSPACGQWDYLTYTFLYQHTGIIDSSVSKVDSI